jgi:hypothetical protein
MLRKCPYVQMEVVICLHVQMDEVVLSPQASRSKFRPPSLQGVHFKPGILGLEYR